MYTRCWDNVSKTNMVPALNCAYNLVRETGIKQVTN